VLPEAHERDLHGVVPIASGNRSLIGPSFPSSVTRRRRIDWLSKQLAGKTYLVGEKFSVADAYLFTVLSWAGHVGFDLSRWPVVQDYVARVGAQPKVAEAMKAEGLLA
jgi:glutathione S-transferase